jgi:hypothetical protein
MALIQLSETLQFTTRKTVDGRTGQCWNGIKLASHLLHHRCGQTTFLLPTPSFSDISGSQSMEIHKDRLEIPWEIPSGKRLHNYGKSPFLMGKLTINHHFQ